MIKSKIPKSNHKTPTFFFSVVPSFYDTQPHWKPVTSISSSFIFSWHFMPYFGSMPSLSDSALSVSDSTLFLWVLLTPSWYTHPTQPRSPCVIFSYLSCLFAWKSPEGRGGVLVTTIPQNSLQCCSGEWNKYSVCACMEECIDRITENGSVEG